MPACRFARRFARPCFSLSQLLLLTFKRSRLFTLGKARRRLVFVFSKPYSDGLCQAVADAGNKHEDGAKVLLVASQPEHQPPQYYQR